MDKKKREALVKEAKARVDKRHKDSEPKVEVQAEVKAEPKAKVVKPVVGGAMPKLPSLPKVYSTERKPKPTQPCMCGCETLTKGVWAPGHDARARGWAIRVERAICKLADVPANEQAGAKHFLKLRKDVGSESAITLVKGKNKAEPEVVEQVAAVNE